MKLQPNYTLNLELNNRPKSSGLYSVFVRIQVDRKPRRFYTGHDIPLSLWNSRSKTVKNRYEHLGSLQDKIKELESQWVTDHPVIHPGWFFPFADGFVQTQGYHTAKGLNNELQKFSRFMNNPELMLTDITPQILYRFHDWLQRVQGNSLNTANKSLSKLRTIVYRAIREGLLTDGNNPFRLFTLRETRPKRVWLNALELERFENLDLSENKTLEGVRDFWLFSYYCAGIRFSDVCCLTGRNLEDTPDGIRLHYTMRKTARIVQSEHSIRIPRQALAILDKYRPREGFSPTRGIFPILLKGPGEYIQESLLLRAISSRNAQINVYLKQICAKARINKPLSFHSARHTFGDTCRKKTGDIYALSKLLRHGQLKTTEKYVSQFDTEHTDEVMDSLFG